MGFSPLRQEWIKDIKRGNQAFRSLRVLKICMQDSERQNPNERN
jgi:hypothetical protein